MKKHLLALFIILTPPFSNSCEVSTNKINFEKFINLNIAKKIKDNTNNKTFIIFNNGDLLASYTEDCGLSQEILYLSKKGFKSQKERNNRVLWVFRLLDRKQYSVENEIKEITNDKTIILKGEYRNERHMFEFNTLTTNQPLDINLFAESIYYTWIPPYIDE